MSNGKLKNVDDVNDDCTDAIMTIWQASILKKSTTRYN